MNDLNSDTVEAARHRIANVLAEYVDGLPDREDGSEYVDSIMVEEARIAEELVRRLRAGEV